MRHIIRINEGGKGYTLYSGTRQDKMEPCDLDMPSTNVPANYIAAQRRIDNLLTPQVSRWHIAIVHKDTQRFPVVAYGCMLPIKDEIGRAGISFIHGIETDETVGIDQAVNLIIQIQAQQTFIELTKEVELIANGANKPDGIFRLLIERFKTRRLEHSQSTNNMSRPIKQIMHDCGGASAVAWTAMAVSHLRTSYGWEIYEEYHKKTGQIATISSSPDALETLTLSDYLKGAVWNYEFSLSQPIEGLRYEVPRQQTVKKREESLQMEKRVSNPNYSVPVSLSGNRQDSFSIQRRLQVQEGLSNKGYTFPLVGQIVKLISVYEELVVLGGETKDYNIDSHNCIKFEEYPLYYEIYLTERAFLVPVKTITLILPKIELTSRAVERINHFKASLHQPSENPHKRVLSRLSAQKHGKPLYKRLKSTTSRLQSHRGVLIFLSLSCMSIIAYCYTLLFKNLWPIFEPLLRFIGR